MRLMTIFDRLHRQHGPQFWWPGDTPFEIMVGAILTQNTAWTNVEKAIANLKRENKLNAGVIAAIPLRSLARLLKPAGYFNVKARRLKAFCHWFMQQGGYAGLVRHDTNALRHSLLAVHGVGPETADDILLYAFSRPVFVIDAYTRRLFTRLGITNGTDGYETLRTFFEKTLARELLRRRMEPTEIFNEYHALIVAHAKYVCKKRPVCHACGLRNRCPSRVDGSIS